MTDLRLVIPALAAWATAALLPLAPDAAGWLALALWGVAVAAVAVLVAKRRGDGRRVPEGRAGGLPAVAAAIALCAAVAGLVGVAVWAALPARHPPGLERLSQHTVSIRAVVDSPEQSAASSFGGPRVRFSATVESARAGRTGVRARMPVLIFAPEGTRVSIGERIEGSGNIVVLPASSKTAALIYLSSPPASRTGPNALLSATNEMRDAFSARATRLPGDGGQLLPGLAIGDVRAVSDGLDGAMKASSLTHLLAVSGANCAVVTSLVAAIAAAAGLGRTGRVVSAGVALIGFVVLVTPQPSVIRAATMAVVVLIGVWSGRPGRSIAALSLAIVVLLALNPWLALDYGFVLSVLATGALVLLAPPLTERLARWVPGRVAAVVAVPLAAQLACQPVLLLLAPTVPLYGVLANLVAEPAAPIATMLGLFSCLLTPLWPGAAALVAQLAWLPASWIAGVARAAETLPASGIVWFAGWAGFALMVVLTVMAVVVVMRPRGRRARFARWAALAAGSAVVVTAAAGAGGTNLAETLTRPGDWAVAACDVGQGDAVLVRGGESTALVDVGPDPDPLAACLTKLGIDRIGLLVLTHYDADHVGGLDAVLGRVDIALIGPVEDSAGARARAALERSGANVHEAEAGDAGTLGSASWRVIWPDPGVAGMTDGNERSVVMVFETAGLSALFLGDLDERAQAALLRTGSVPQVDIAKVAHHGSADQAEPLYQALRPQIGLVSVGAGNDYGHPTAAALGILAREGAAPMRTDLQGMILVAPGAEGGLRTWTERVATDAQLQAPAVRSGRSWGG